MRRPFTPAILAASFLYLAAGSPAVQAQRRAVVVQSRTGGVSRHVGPQTGVRIGVGNRNGVQIGVGIDLGNTRGIGRHNFRGGNIYYSNPCLRGGCAGYYSGYYYPYYTVPIVIGGIEDNGPYLPDFNDRPSAYTIAYGSARVPAEYVAPGADAVSAAYRQGQMEQRITSLADEVARLRAEKEARQAEAARQGGPNRGYGTQTNELPDQSFANAGTLDANAPSSGGMSAATATLVFRDGRRLDVSNYAVVGQTLWVFDEQRARRVPLADLNLDATKKANIENGFDFKLPATK